MSDTLTVTQAIAKVMTELPAIGKGGKADPSQGGYAYRGIEQITSAAQRLFGAHGVVFVPEVVKTEVKDITVASKPWTDTFLQVVYHVYGPGGDSIDVGPLFAIGRDNSDKGSNKAMTQAFKQALLQVLCISDSKDDSDGQSHEADEREPVESPLWERMGFTSEDAFKAENASLQELWRTVPEENRPGVVEWLKARGYDRPVPVHKADVEAYRELLREALDGATTPAADTDESAAEVALPDAGYESMEAAFRAMPELHRQAARDEIKRTFGEPLAMLPDESRAAVKMIKDWPTGDPVPAPEPAPVQVPSSNKKRTAKHAALVAYAKGKGYEEKHVVALVSYLNETLEPAPIEDLDAAGITSATSLLDDAAAGRIVFEETNGMLIAKDPVPA